MRGTVTRRMLEIYLLLLGASVFSVLAGVVLVYDSGPEDVAVVEDSLRGGALLAVDALDAADDREATRAALEERFGYPIALLPPAPLDRPVRFEMDAEGREFLYAALASGERARFGPLPTFSLPPARRLLGGVAVLALLWAAIAGALIRPQLRALRALEAAADRLASGDWGSRIADALPGHARPLARAFDRMAAEIEGHIAARRQMMQVVSHELRTPLTRLQFGVDLLADATSDAEREAQAEGLFQDIAALDALVEELQEFVRLDRPAPVKRAPGDLAARLAKIAGDRQLGATAIALPALPPDAPPILVDPRAFDRAVGNLVSNALRHASGQVQIRAERRGDAWWIAVEDDGPGVPEADRARVWEPFARSEASGGSAGLGLAIVRRIARDHGGAVGQEASELGGASFWTTWPDGGAEPA